MLLVLFPLSVILVPFCFQALTSESYVVVLNFTFMYPTAFAFLVSVSLVLHKEEIARVREGSQESEERYSLSPSLQRSLASSILSQQPLYLLNFSLPFVPNLEDLATQVPNSCLTTTH